MEQFLKSVERRAFRMAQIATGSRDDALDVLQDAMLEFVRAYAHKPMDQWKPLFYRIVQNKIRDWRRRSKVRNIFVTFLPGRRQGQDQEDADPLQTLRDPEAPDPYTRRQDERGHPAAGSRIKGSSPQAAAGLSAPCLGGSLRR